MLKFWGRRLRSPKPAHGNDFEVTICDLKSASVEQQRWKHPATDEHGDPIWPDNPDEVPAWRLEREAWAWEYGVLLPGYRTKRDWWAAEELAEMSNAPKFIASEAKELSPDEMAAQFLAHLRDNGHCGQHSVQRLNELYNEFCEESGLSPGKIDHVKAALALMQPSVEKSVRDYRISGKRKREVQWIIHSAEMQQFNDVEELKLAA